MLHKGVVQGFIRMCNDGWLAGWHERNGGNATCRLIEGELELNTPQTDWRPIGVTATNLAGQFFITTGTGKYFRNIAQNPAENIGVVEISPCGSMWRTVWGLENGALPTSEFPSHILNHSVRMEVTQGRDRVIYHAHPTALIALTFVLPPEDRAITKALWSAITECAVVFPEGVGALPWMVCGGEEIAQASCDKMKTYSAVAWAHHGLFCSGPDFDATFGLMHTIEKAADIHLRAMQCGIRQSITDDNLRELARAYGVQLNEGLL